MPSANSAGRTPHSLPGAHTVRLHCVGARQLHPHAKHLKTPYFPSHAPQRPRHPTSEQRSDLQLVAPERPSSRALHSPLSPKTLRKTNLSNEPSVRRSRVSKHSIKRSWMLANLSRKAVADRCRAERPRSSLHSGSARMPHGKLQANEDNDQCKFSSPRDSV